MKRLTTILPLALAGCINHLEATISLTIINTPAQPTASRYVRTSSVAYTSKVEPVPGEYCFYELEKDNFQEYCLEFK